jgi:tetratricopeptide (TPR) repeat protein
MILLLVMMTLPVASFGNIDSLRIEYRLATTDTLRARLLISIGDRYERNLPDSAIYYYQQVVELAENSQEQSRKLFEQKGTALRYIGIIHRARSEFSLARDYYYRSLEIFQKHDLEDGIASVYNNLGVLHRQLGQYPEALEYYHQALIIHQRNHNEEGLAFCYNNMGVILDIMQEYQQALEYYQRARNFFEEQNMRLMVASNLSNTGSTYFKLDELDTALEYYYQALEIYIDLNRRPQMARLYMNLYSVNNQKGDLDQAISYLEKSRELAEELNDRKSLVTILVNHSSVNRRRGNLVNARSSARQALEIALEINTLNDQVIAYNEMHQVEAASGNMGQAYEFARQYISLNDSLNSIERSRALLELEARFQNEQKQQEIELLSQREENQRLQIIQKEAEMQRQRFILILVLIIMVMGLAFLIQKIRQNRRIRETNQKLEAQYEEIQRKNKEIRIQRNEIEKQRNLVLAQKGQIEKQNEALTEANREILSGIRYAEKIQSALFPDEAYLTEHLGESFIFFKPKSIVSGDFYWLSHKNGKTYMAVADCTGHGVAGGLLSMLGIAFLNESLHNNGLKTAADFLEYLTGRFDESLLVSEEGRQTREGMEISFCIYDKEDTYLEFAGAGASIAIVSTSHLELFKGDRRGIGHTGNEKKPYTCYEIQTSAGDMVYIFSDGYINQFGGENGQRYTSAGFFNLLENISPHNLAYQKSLLENELDRWKNNVYEQIDDILVMGFRI